MNTADAEGRVRRLVAEVLWTAADDLEATTPLVDYGLDSLRAVELVTLLEDEFGLALPEDVVAGLHTVSDMVRLVEAEAA